MDFDFIPLPARLAARLGLPPEKSIPVTPEIRARLGQEGPSVEAIVAGCEAYLAVDPDDTDYRAFVRRYYHHRGVTLANEGRLEEAFELFGRARLLDGADPQVHLDFAQAATELERAEEAIEGYQAAMAAGARTPEVYDGLARAFGIKGDWKSALGAAEQSRREFPDSLVPLNTLTTVYYHSGDKAAMEKILFEQLQRDPQNPLTLEKLAVWFRECGRFAEAQRAVRRALELAPGEARLLYQRGMIEMRSGDSEAAEKTFRGILRHAPDDLDARTALAVLLLETSRPADAETILADSAARFPADYRAPFHLGRLCSRVADRLDEGLRHFERVLDLRPRDRQAVRYVYILASNSGAAALAARAREQMRVLGDEPGEEAAG